VEKEPTTSAGVLGPGATWQLYARTAVDGKGVTEVQDGARTTFIYGYASYKDAFGAGHHLTFRVTSGNADGEGNCAWDELVYAGEGNDSD
jgi:hypothetical protein